MGVVNPVYFINVPGCHLALSVGCINPCVLTEKLILLCLLKQIEKLNYTAQYRKEKELMKVKKKFEIEVELAELSQFIRSGIAPCSMVSSILKQIQREEEKKTKQEVMF